MIESIYREDLRVLVTRWTPKELQDRLSVVSKEIEVLGIIGSDVVAEKLMGPDISLRTKYQQVFMRGVPIPKRHFEDTVGALMALKADSFLVALRGEEDFSSLGGYIGDRPIRAFVVSSDLSSTKARKAVCEGAVLDHILDRRIRAIVTTEGMYQ